MGRAGPSTGRAASIRALRRDVVTGDKLGRRDAFDLKSSPEPPNHVGRPRFSDDRHFGGGRPGGDDDHHGQHRRGPRRSRNSDLEDDDEDLKEHSLTCTHIRYCLVWLHAFGPVGLYRNF